MGRKREENCRTKISRIIVKEKERIITAPEGCEIENVELVDGVAVVTFREKERKLPKSWEEFCEMYDVSDTEYFIDDVGGICNAIENKAFISRDREDDKNILPDRATAEAVLALCQLIQLRDCYNGDWVPDWRKGCDTFTIEIDGEEYEIASFNNIKCDGGDPDNYGRFGLHTYYDLVEKLEKGGDK